MKIFWRALTVFFVVSGLLFLVSCQGPNLFDGQLKNKVTFAFTGYAKKIASSASSRSLAPAIVKHMSKQEFLATRGHSGSARLINPDTAYYEILVSAPDMATIDEIYVSSGNGIVDFLDLYVPAGYARSFVINLWASDFSTNLGSTEVVSDVVISPTYIDALIQPNNAAISPSHTVAMYASPTQIPLSDINVNLLHFDFSSESTAPLYSFRVSASGIDTNNPFVVIPFDITGNMIDSSSYTETAGSNYSLDVNPHTSYDSNGSPITNFHLYALIYSYLQSPTFSVSVINSPP